MGHHDNSWLAIVNEHVMAALHAIELPAVGPQHVDHFAAAHPLHRPVSTNT
jgi:hypothetical protein